MFPGFLGVMEGTEARPKIPVQNTLLFLLTHNLLLIKSCFPSHSIIFNQEKQVREGDREGMDRCGQLIIR